MSEHSDKAAALFRSGYNCSQSVLGAFSDRIPIPFETAVKLASPFGGGIGRLRETCGAATGMLMVLGLTEGYSDTSDLSLKADHYRLVQQLMKAFEKELGSFNCRELLGGIVSTSPVPAPRTPDFYLTRPCERIIRKAAEILDEHFAQEQDRKV